MARPTIYIFDNNHRVRTFTRVVRRLNERYALHQKRHRMDRCERLILEGERDPSRKKVYCMLCGLAFEDGDKVFSHPKRTQSIRHFHIGCAMQMSRISDDDDIKLIETKSKERNFRLNRLEMGL